MSANLSIENSNFLINYNEIELSLKATRRSFILLLFFDLTFTCLLWLIYCSSKGLSLDEAYEEEIKKYKFDSSIFDVAVASIFRFIFFNLFYTILKFSNWIPAAILTFTSSSFLISKVIIFAIKGTHKILTDYLVLIISFLIVWAQIGYLDMKIFSLVKKKNILINTDSTISNASMVNYGSVNTNRGILSEVTSYYASPLDSPQEFSEEESEQRTLQIFEKQKKFKRKISSSNIKSALIYSTTNCKEKENHEYENVIEEAFRNLIDLKNDKKDWNVNEFFLIELLSDKNIMIEHFDPKIKCSIQTKYFPKIGKVFKLDTIFPFNEKMLLKVLRDDVEQCSDWNITVKSSKIISKIREDLSILYICVNEQAGGLVSQRDFVNLSGYFYFENQDHVLATIACKSDKVPVNDSYVRGENGPSGYFISQIDEDLTRFTWILNVNLKGWLPQYLIDQSLYTAQKDFIASLIKHLNQVNA